MTLPSTQNESGPVLARLDAARVGVLLLLLLPALAIFRGGLGDPDLWLHLQAGRWISEHGRVPWQDPFSYTARGHRWIAYSWLPEVLFYRVTEGPGFGALIVLTAVLGSTLVGLLYLSCRANGAARNASLAVAALAGAATSGAWTERPQLLSLVLLAVLLWWLRSSRLRPHLWWAAPLLVVVWVNVHLLFSVGIGLLALDAACSLYAGRRHTRCVVAVATASLASLANPYGWSLLAQLGTMSAQRVAAAAVVELQPPDFASPLGAMMTAFLLVSITAFATTSARLTCFELVSYLLALAGGLTTARAMAIFAIVAAPTVARHLRLPERGPEPARRVPLRLLCLHYAIVAAALVAALLFAPHGRGWREHLVPGAFPEAAADFVAERYAGKRLFNDFDSGGFLIFRLYPQTPVSIDGRTEVYGGPLLERYGRTHFVRRGWERFLRECDPDVILWPADTPFAELLESLPAWRKVFADSTAVVFERVRAG